MDTFLHNVFTFPTVFYSGLLVLVVLYWLSAVVGFADVDVFDGDVDLDVDADPGFIASWLTRFKLDGIPLTITLSFVILGAWILSFLAVHFLYPILPEGWVQIAIGFWVLLLAPVIAAILVSPLLQPLKPLFKKLPEKNAASLLGRYVIVRSSKVTTAFGEADLADGGAGLILKIRAAEPNAFKRGDKVMLHSYDPASNTYNIISA